jgi:hypothetical protein
MNKRCTVCGETKDISEFASAGKSKKRAQCKPCLARKKREYYKKNPDKARRRNLMTYYGLTVEQREQMAIDRDFRCDMCKRQFSDDELCVDHCHDTNKVRGLLCTNCNLTLGHAHDDVQTLQNGINYLTFHKNND